MDKLICELRTWEQMRGLAEDVAAEIRESGFRPDYIVAIVRGGMVPAMNLSDLLGVYDVLTLRVRHWGATAVKDKKAVLDIPLNASIAGKKILLVDDLTDTGDSIVLALENIKKLSPAEVRVATLIHKASSKVEPDYYAEKIEKWRWVIFPWNIFEDLSALIAKARSGKEAKSIRGLREALKDSFSLDVDAETLEKVRSEMKRRSQT
jgi:hypothetical protein